MLLGMSGVLWGCGGASRGERLMTTQGSHAGVNLHSSERTVTVALSGEPAEVAGSPAQTEI